MRRLLVLPLLVAAAFAVSTPANAAVQCYGVQGGNVLVAGVCAGSECSDLCFLVVDPYCQSGTINAAAKPAPPEPCRRIDAIVIR
jgi:hypothetical protein